MKRIKLLIAFCFIMLNHVWAQDCNCENNLKVLVSSIEQNYVGFDNKVNTSNRKAYEAFKSNLEKGSKSSAHYKCYLLLKEYIRYFKDPHMSLSIANGEGVNTDSLKELFKDFKPLAINEDSLKSYFISNKIEDIEGIWETPLIKYQVAIIKDTTTKGGYIGITLGGDGIFWRPYQVKMEIYKSKSNYRVKYLRNDHYPDDRSLKIENGNILIAGYGTWSRAFPSGNTTAPDNSLVKFRRLSDSACSISIGNFWITQKPAIDSIIGSNLDVIQKSKYFLIDLRNNGGGHIMSTDTLLPLVVSGPVYRDAMFVKSTRDNIETYKRLMQTPGFTDENRTYFQELITKMEKNIGRRIKTSEPDTIHYEHIYSNPQKVAILINEGTMSSAELFLIWAKQSTKVTIFGTHSKGALDYAEIGDVRKLPCPYLSFTCPMGTTEHKIYPYIDNIGIKPDVEIKEAETDWPAYVIRYYETHP